MKSVLGSALFIATLFVANILHAQLSGENLSAIETGALLPANEMPISGTFYSAANPGLPPIPSNFFGDSGWNVGGGIYLLDDLDGSSGGFHPDDSGPPGPGDGGSGGGSNIFSGGSFIFPTNGLWLSITNATEGTIYANLNNATDYVYAITSATNLTASSNIWNIETEVFPGISANSMPFTVSMNGRNSLFLSAMDWTGITASGNQTPSWWLWLYFDTTDLSDTNLDSSGNTLLYDYENGLDPNVIQFSIAVTNQYVNNTNLPIQTDVIAGTPFYVATLIDSTNFAGAVWNAYTSSNIIVNVGSLQSWHNVYVGLRGFPANATQTWQWQHLDFVSPPLLALTKPLCSVVDEPVIQVYGYAQEQLASISYDISNASGILTNQDAEITDEYFDTNQLGITTNDFECLDVPLTNGLNVITLYATDLAGDTTVSNFDFTLDYSSKTNPPVVQFTWPQPGTEISGTNCMFTGWISDPTATLTVQVTVTNSNFTNLFSGGIYTNVYPAYIDRTGNFWLKNLPLQPGSNTFSITATDAAGNICTTNLSVVQTNFVLTLNPMCPISQPTVSVSGSISDPNYAVWVNGVKGINNGNGTWSADNVPATNGNFTVTAYGPDEQQPDGSYGN